MIAISFSFLSSLPEILSCYIWQGAQCSSFLFLVDISIWVGVARATFNFQSQPRSQLIVSTQGAHLEICAQVCVIHIYYHGNVPR